MKRKKEKRNRSPVGNNRAAAKPEIPIIEERVGGERRIEEQSEIYQAIKPSLSANEVETRLHESSATGEEAVGGHAPTPDQDVVAELGEAAGIEFQDNQPLQTHEEIWAERDRRRWELDRRSADDASS